MRRSHAAPPPLWPLAVGLALAGCHVEQAPPELEAVFGELWRTFDAEDDDVANTIDRVLSVISVEESDGNGLGGEHLRLAVEDLQPLAFYTPEGEPSDPPDPQQARALYVIDRVGCDSEALPRMMAYPDQSELLPGRYDSYERTYDGEPADFADGTVDRLDYRGVVGIPGFLGVLKPYDYVFEGQMRRIDLPEDDARPLAAREAWLQRSWIPHPVLYRDEGVEQSLSQDHQFELFLPLDDGSGMLHVYPFWREMVVPPNDMETDFLGELTLTQTRGWARALTKACEAGIPPL